MEKKIILKKFSFPSVQFIPYETPPFFYVLDTVWVPVVIFWDQDMSDDLDSRLAEIRDFAEKTSEAPTFNVQNDGKYMNIPDLFGKCWKRFD